MLTNWLGYRVLAGIVCLLQPIALPEKWALGSDALRVLGVLSLLLSAAYVALCGLSRRRSWTLRMALLQLMASCTAWLLIASVTYTLLQHRVDYPTVLAALLVYRAVHYLIPLAQASVLYVLFEIRLKARARIPLKP